MGYIPGCTCGPCTRAAERRGGVPPVVKTPIIPLDPVKSPEASNTFYAIFGTNCKGYLQTDGSFQYLAGDVKQAKQFSSVGAALQYIARGYRSPGNDFGPIEIRRITRSTTPGTTSRRVLDHGEQAPVGAKVKYGVVNLHTIEKGLGLQLSLRIGSELHVSEIGANQARPNKEDNGWGVRRVIETVTDAKVTYKEEVVQ